MVEAYGRGRQKRKAKEEDTMENQPKAPNKDKQRRHRPTNRYVRTPTAPTTTQPTASPPRDVYPCAPNPHETKPPEKLHTMTAEETTINYIKCIAKYNQFCSTHSSIPHYVELYSEHLIKEGDEQLGLRNIQHNFAQWLLTNRPANGMFYAPGTTLHFFSNFKTVLCHNFDKVQIIKDISKSIRGGGSQTWYSELFKMLEM
eukprot:10499414-Ditylum_brightwellii.AAC.1